MKKPTLNFLIDFIAFINMILLTITGIFLKFYLPHGQGFGRSHGRGPLKTILGLTRHEWGDVHFWLAISLIILIIIHLILHWSWVKCMVKNTLTR